MDVWDRPNEQPRGYLKPAYRYIRDKLGSNLVGAEIGIAQGYGTEYVLDGLNFKKFYMIDPYAPYEFNETSVEDFNKQHAETSNKFRKYTNAEMVRMHSAVAVNMIPDNSMDFVYIDGNHMYQYAKQDIALWWPKVRSGGVLAGHDYTDIPEGESVDNHLDIFQYKGVHYGVIKAVNEFAASNNLILQLGELDWWVDKI